MLEGYASGVDVVYDFVAREESEGVGEGFEGVDGGEDVLEIDCIVRCCGSGSVKRICRCIDYCLLIREFQ